jgi:hypothetical protein
VSARVPNQLDGPPEQVEPADPREHQVGVGEMLPHVAERGSPEHRVRDGVAHHVAVRMPCETLPGIEADAAERQRAPGRERVHVEPQAHERFGHRGRASASRRSSAVVIFRFVRSPSIARTR